MDYNVLLKIFICDYKRPESNLNFQFFVSVKISFVLCLSNSTYLQTFNLRFLMWVFDWLMAQIIRLLYLIRYYWYDLISSTTFPQDTCQ